MTPRIDVEHEIRTLKPPEDFAKEERACSINTDNPITLPSSANHFGAEIAALERSMSCASYEAMSISPCSRSFQELPPNNEYHPSPQEPESSGSRSTGRTLKIPVAPCKRKQPCKEPKSVEPPSIDAKNNIESSSESFSLNEDEKRQLKLEKNRRSARESRKRKKDYFDSLENEVWKIRHPCYR